MLRLDVGTLAFTAAMTSLVCGLVIAAHGITRHRTYRWNALGTSALLYGLGLLLVVHRGEVPSQATLLGGNLLILAAAVALHVGCAQLTGRLPSPLSYALYLGPAAAVAGYFIFDESINARVTAISLVRLPLFAHGTWLIWRQRSRENISGFGLLVGALVLMGLVLAARSLSLVFIEGHIREYAALGGVQALFFGVMGLGYVAVTIALMMVDTGRMTALLGREVSRQAEALETTIARQVRDRERLRRSEADLRAILDNMPDIFYRTDREGRLLMTSRSVESLLGYSVEEVLGREAEFFHVSPESRVQFTQALNAAGGSIIDYELRLRHKDGRLLWASTSTRFYYDADGKPAGTEGVVRLIEERKRAELCIRESQSLIQAMLDASSDAIMLFKPDGTLLAVNEVMARRFNHSAAELTGLCLWDMFPPDVGRARRETVQRVVESGEAVHYLDRRGELYLDNSIYPVMGGDGVPDKVAVYSRDITAQTQAEQKIATYLAELERSNAELEQFAYVASHDLREPLRMISSYLSLLERRYGSRLEKDGTEFLEFARDGAKRMDRLVLDLLEFSRIERKGSPIVAMEAEAALHQALQHLSPAIAESGAAVEITGEGETPRVMGDPDQVIRLFQNLVGNALKYRAEGRAPRISVSWRRAGSEWEFQVADNGIGIEEQYFERIFRIFQRLHTPDRYEGTGIGLAICKKIVERHAGRIWVESVPDEGTTFHFTLPAA